jgi:basic amino acid/polyamine antiporter, APA family
VLLAFEDNTYSEDALITALKLSSHRRGDIGMIVTLTVPQHLDIAAPLPEAEETARAIIEEARQWCGRGQRLRGRIVKVRPGEAGHRIVQEAIDAHAEAIVMPMPHHRPAGRVLSKTLETVLAKRPSRVIIDSAAAAPYERIPHAA